MAFVEKIRRYVAVNKWEIVAILTLFFVAALPRLLDLGIFLTADEKNWITRSYEFVRAFKDLRFNDMLQTTHPGVTTMWVSGAAITAKLFVSDIPFSLSNLTHFIKAAQFPIALANALAIPFMYVFARRLFSSAVIPLVGTIFIALDPFIVGYSRVAHVDALLMSLLFLAALAIIVHAKEGYSRAWLIVSGILAALALLTKAPAIFIFPFYVLVILLHEGREILRKEVWIPRIRDFFVWTLLIVILFLLLWPAILWVPNPEGNVLLLKRDLSTAASTPHHMAEDYTLNAWHYPATLVARVSPVIQLLSFAALSTYLLQLIKKKWAALRSVRGLLFAYILFFIIMMTLGAKKGDRYILPVFAAINMVAAIGLWDSVRLISRKVQTVKVNLLQWIGVGVVTIVLLVTVLSYHPYTIAYSNPLFPDNLSQELGWGEGLDQVGAWLSQQYPDATVASWYSQELQAYTSAEVLDISAHEHPQTEFVVLYRNMFGRAQDHPATDYIEQYYNVRQPVFVAHVAGKEYAWVYARRSYEAHVGELLPGVRVQQELPVRENEIIGVAVLVPTFSGRADQGKLVVRLRSESSGAVIREWSIPVADIANDEWVKLYLSDSIGTDSTTMVVEVETEGTQAENAPTVRLTRQHDYIPGNVQVFEDGRWLEKKGDLAVQLIYATDAGERLEEQL